ncbi:MAG: carboxypeptidase-like regulatory domain-containing protein [Geminicoccaceae bacterium]
MDGWRSWLINRVTITFAVIAVALLAWNLHVRAHDDGLLVGHVVDHAGRPVAGAKVVLNERTIVSLAPIAETTTDEAGRFRFTRHDRHALVLTAEKDGIGVSARVAVKLYFRNQNRTLEDPIVLEGEA